MLDLKQIEQNPELVRESLKKRHSGAETLASLDKLLSLNEERRKLITETDQLRSERKSISKEFGMRKKKGEDVSDLAAKMDELKEKLPGMEEKQKAVQEEVDNILLSLPNVLVSEVPDGKDDTENVEVKKWGEPTSFDFEAQAHWDLGENSNLIDLKRGAKLTGSRFYVLWNEGAQLERALINFFMDMYAEKGYQEIWSPFMVNGKTMTGTGQLPKFEEDLFKIEGLDYYLIPTAEVPVTNLYSGEVLAKDEIPQKFCCFTACFRKEAGSYGKDTRGIIRVHQFNKVELVKLAPAESSEDEHQKLLSDIEEALQLLKLPYRVVMLCGGDTGFSAQKCYDIEVWLPSEEKYREISSVSNFGDFQARRANIKYKNGDGKNTLVHTLNGSGLAVGRTMVAIMENYQNADGSITVPEVLVPYMRGKTKIGGSKK